ncbi:Glycosyltransferase involved in cell wall bisynthesis [Pedobacter sp. ok626]|uniref:glycosyltransferase family 2 protein n=1 Tax=Pedobacter sp. ok626 TaxID=1761882 RepID=UPI00088D5D07|nr:glycosyltransferase family 2 protein [Pedobacter sp. ok626]SDK80892.1 Glycosyltransferase involved in cell wall bisynthesis [Pedobacter sp. ok626]
MLKEPLISVIVPTYNYGNYINFTLDCVLSQHYKNIEVIVVDDGSTDNTAQVLNNYCQKDDRIKYFYQENRGLSSARNLGLEKSKGDFIQFLDSDDLISDFKLSLQIEAFREDPRIHISYTKCFYFIGENTDVLFAGLNLSNEDWMPKICGQGIDALKELVISNIMPVNSALISRRMITLVHSFNEDFKSLEDWDFWLRCAFKNGFFKYLSNDKAYGLIRVHENSMSQNRSRMYDYEIKLRQDIETYLTEIRPATQKDIDRLRKINNKKIKNLLSIIIANAGPFDFDKFKQLIKDSGFYMFFKSYIKFINDKRKIGSS